MASSESILWKWPLFMQLTPWGLQEEWSLNSIGLFHDSQARYCCFLQLDQRLSKAIVPTMGGVIVRKLPVFVEMQIHSGELPAVCFGGSVWKGKVYSKTRKNSKNQSNVIILNTTSLQSNHCCVHIQCKKYKLACTVVLAERAWCYL